MKKIALIGSTGSIGVQTLNVIRRNPDKYSVVSISAGSNAGLFVKQIEEFRPKVATIATELNKDYVAPKETQIFSGEDAFTNAIIDDADLVVIALVGFKGIVAVLDAIKKRKNIALANKESLVVGGSIVTRLAMENGVTIVPIDSEHSAIWQALDFDFNKPFKKIIITASGGAFRDYSVEQIKKAKAKEALNHPNWKMGEKITIDCATMVNKAFEVAEAHWLYNAPFDKIDVIIHRESIIHSMVEYNDNSVIAQMSYPNMELPISLALSYPERLSPAVESLDFAKLGKLSFEELNHEKYPCFNTVVNACKKGGVYPAIANGANEIAVKLFLCDKIEFNDIYKAINESLNAYKGTNEENIDNIINANNFAVNFVKNKFGE